MRNQKTLTLDEEKLIIDNRQKLVELEKDLNIKERTREHNFSYNKAFFKRKFFVAERHIFMLIESPLVGTFYRKM